MTAPSHHDCPRCGNKLRRNLQNACMALIVANLIAWSVFDVAAIFDDRCTEAEHNARSDVRAGKHAVPLDDRLSGNDKRANGAADLEQQISELVIMHRATLAPAHAESIA